MRLAPLFGLMVVVGILASCSGSSETGKCQTADECNQGFTCVSEKCAQVECVTHADCPGDDPFCAPAGVDPTQSGKKFCSPIKCKSDEDCEDGFTCDKYKQCIPKEAPADATNTEVEDQDVVTPQEIEDDVPVTPVGSTCTSCSSDADCGKLKCYPLGGGTFCFGNCNSNADCPTGWMCYALSNEGQQCIPMAFNCDADCLKTGCPAGQVCNQETGACVDGKPQCGACAQDWDCQEGYKCYQDGKYCAPVCPDGVCPKNGTCQEVNTLKVKLCVSGSATCCYGDTCANACPPETPHAYNGKCVECLSDAHCGANKHCTAEKTCQSNNCQPPTPYDFNGTCVECLNTTHCSAKGENYICDQGQHKCVTSEQPDECSYCVDPYPACTQINGVWSCVQCTDNTYCGGNECDLSLFACKGGSGCGSCTNDSQCISAMGDKTLACDTASGCCYDVKGWCDGVESMCNTGAASECLGLMDMLMGGMGGIPGMPGMPEGSAFGVCTCSEPAGADALLCLFMGGCPAGGCFGDAICIDPAAIPMLGDMLGGLAGGGGICLNPSSLMDLLGGGGLPF